MTKQKLKSLISIYSNSKKIYQQISNLDANLKGSYIKLEDPLTEIFYSGFKLAETIIILFDLPEDNSKNYSHFMFEKYEEENFIGMVCHDYLNDIIYKWLLGEHTDEEFVDFILEYVSYYGDKK